MPDGMSEYRPDTMPDGMSEYMPDGMSVGGGHSKKVIWLLKQKLRPTCSGQHPR